MATALSAPVAATLAMVKAEIATLVDLGQAEGLLGWDLETQIPAKGQDQRANVSGTLARLYHERMTALAFVDGLAQLRAPETLATLSPVDQAMVREMGRSVDHAVKLPVALVQAMSETTSRALPKWVEARKNSDFKTFAPTLEKVIELNREKAQALDGQKGLYNTLLDLYEPDCTTDHLDPVFDALAPALTAWVEAITEQASPLAPLNATFDTDRQLAFCREVLTHIGFDFEAGRLDLSAHPFSMGLGPLDVRLTTRVMADDPFSCLYSALHEMGHGLYEQGMNPDLLPLGLANGASLGLHESQSRLWENLVGRSQAFWGYATPVLQRAFPGVFEGASPADLYRQVNTVQRSLIRVEADEVTYNLHIILRYRLERDLLDGRLAVADLPEAWNSAMQRLLGLMPKNDAEGCLQDVHWAHGTIGYFPTYTLGNVYSAQIFDAARRAMPSLDADLARGVFQPLRAWLQAQIHSVGSVETTEQIIRRVTGGGLSVAPFLSYLEAKYGALYGVKPTPLPAGSSR